MKQISLLFLLTASSYFIKAQTNTKEGISFGLNYTQIRLDIQNID